MSGAAELIAGGEMTSPKEGSSLPKKTLVWHKLPMGGFIPSGREGHSSVGANKKMYIFGGMETGRRVNTMQVLDVATGHWSNDVVGNRDLRIDAEIHKLATNDDDVSAHKGVGRAENIDEDADFDPDAVESKNPFVPTPRCHHASCLIEFDVEINRLPSKKISKVKLPPPTPEPVTKRMQLMIVHGGEGTAIQEQEKGEHKSEVHLKVTSGTDHHVHFEDHGKLDKGHKKTKHGKGQSLRDSQFGHTLSLTEHKAILRKREQEQKIKVEGEESRMMTEMDDKLTRMPRSMSAPGGVCVQDTLQNFGHKTGGLRVDKQKSAHLKNLAGADATSKGLASLAHNQQMVLSAQSVVPLEDIFALDVNNGEWIRFETVMGPLPRKGHTLSIGPVSRAALGMSASGDSLDPDRILMNRDKRLGRIQAHQTLSPEEEEEEEEGLQTDPRVQSVMLFGGYNNEHEAYSNTVHLATVENIASSYINLNQMIQEERAALKKDEDGYSDGDTCSESASFASKSNKKSLAGDAAWQLQKEMIKQQNAIKWQVVQTTGNPPAPRYRHTATVIRKSTQNRQPHIHLQTTFSPHASKEGCALVVYGGLGRGNVPLNDVHILDLDTLEWSEITPVTAAARETWPEHGLFGHTAIPIPVRGMFCKPAETEGEVENEDVFGTVPLSAAARLAARSAAMNRKTNKGTNNGAKLGTEVFKELSPEEEMSLFQDVLIVYGGSGGSEEENSEKIRRKRHKHKKRTHSRDLSHHHGHELENEEGEKEEEDYEPLDLVTREKVARESGASHVTRVLDLTTGEWRELHGSITYPSQRVNHSIALVNGWAPGNPARIPIKVGEAHHMNSLPPAPELGSSKRNPAAVGDNSVGGTAISVGIKEGFGEEDEGEEDSCAVVFGGSSLAMCPPDAWVLDLKWRVAGVKGFDTNASSRTRDALAQSIEWSKRTQYASGSLKHLNAAMHHHENHTLHMQADGAAGRAGTHVDLELDPNYSTINQRMLSSAEPIRSVEDKHGENVTDTLNFSHLHLSPAEIESQYGELTAAFRRVKKERAYAELQIKKERERSFECLLRADRAERELRQTNKEFAAHRGKSGLQIKALEDTIKEQTESLHKLKALCDELMLERDENEKVISALTLAARAQRADDGSDGHFKVKPVF